MWNFDFAQTILEFWLCWDIFEILNMLRQFWNLIFTEIFEIMDFGYCSALAIGSSCNQHFFQGSTDQAPFCRSWSNLLLTINAAMFSASFFSHQVITEWECQTGKGFDVILELSRKCPQRSTFRDIHSKIRSEEWINTFSKGVSLFLTIF